MKVSDGNVGVQILQASRLWQIGDAQPLAEAGIVAVGEFLLQKHAEPVLEPQGSDVRIAQLTFARGQHAEEFELIELPFLYSIQAYRYLNSDKPPSR